MKKALFIVALSAFPCLAQTNFAELERERLELAVERAKLEADRARFEAEKAKWEAQRLALAAMTNASQTSASAVVIITNGPADPMYLAQQSTRLYRSGQLAGDLPAGSIVKGKPHPTHAKWLIVTWHGEQLEASAEHLQDAADYVASLERRATAARQRSEETRRELDAARKRRSDVERQLTEMESQRRQTTIFMPPITQTNLTNRPTPVVVLSNDGASGSHAARLRREVTEAERDVVSLEKQLADQNAERERAETALARARAAIDAQAGR